MWGLRNIVTKERRAELHPHRVLTPLVRRPGSKEWEKISWEEAIDAIAKRVKKTRDATFVEKEGDVTVNRCDGIASLGAAQLNNEEAWVVQKFARSLGVVAIDNQTRVCHSSTVSGLAPSFGRGSMTSHWCDFQNSRRHHVDRVEQRRKTIRSPRAGLNAPRDRGATWIVVDPRLTARPPTPTSTRASARVPTSAFYGGLINYILQNDLWHKEYVLHYTNAACLLRPDFSSTKNSVSSPGGIPKRRPTRTRPGATTSTTKRSGTRTAPSPWVKKPGTPKFKTPDLGSSQARYDACEPELRHQRHEAPLRALHARARLPRDRHGSDVMKKVWEVYASTGTPERSGSILYALGQTQHTYGSQNCRAMCIVQLLLGNIGIVGGGNQRASR